MFLEEIDHIPTGSSDVELYDNESELVDNENAPYCGDDKIFDIEDIDNEISDKLSESQYENILISRKGRCISLF